MKNRLNYRSYNDLVNVISSNFHKIPHDVELIVGVPRSGMTPAYILANLLDCGVTDFDSFLSNREVKGGQRFFGREKKAFTFKKVLILDDSIISGSALENVKNKLKGYKISTDLEILFGVIYATSESERLVDFYFELVNSPRVFQWNLFNHVIIEKSCFDLDGVLCYDVPEEYNDDDEKYLDYIENVGVYLNPKRTIDIIVTCRLEKYREVTEKWLKKNNISYNKLVMLDLPDGESRRKWSKHGYFKAEVYSQSSNFLFVESSYSQATIISKETEKAVYCVDTQQMINTNVNPNSNVLLVLTRNDLIKKCFRRVKRFFLNLRLILFMI